MSKAIGKRTILLLAAITATLVACSGAVLALTVVDCGASGQDPLTPQCYGTKQEDDVQGREVADIIFAYGGNDTVHAYGGNDTVDASAGDDLVYGGTGRDALAGGPDDDGLLGGDNADILTDHLNRFLDEDELRGSYGNDRLDAFDHDYNDTLVCGPGNDDTAYFDRSVFLLKQDRVSDTCENKMPNTRIDWTG